MPLVNSFAAASGRSLGFGAASGVSPFDVDFWVVAGGGGGGSGPATFGGGGGGAGGYKASVPGPAPATPSFPAVLPALTVDADVAYPVLIGAGGAGAGAQPGPAGANGSPSNFATIPTTGGGRGGSTADYRGNPGGSGGGVVGINPADASSGIPGQGNPGGNNFGPNTNPTGIGGTGGGGGSSPGTPWTVPTGPRGTAGGSTAYGVPGDGWYPTGAPYFNVAFSGGGGGAGIVDDGGGFGGRGYYNPGPGGSGTANSGYGGGAGYPGFSGGAGGSGAIVLKIPILHTATFTPGVSQHAGSPYPVITPSPQTTPTHRFYFITAAGPSDTVTFGAA